MHPDKPAAGAESLVALCPSCKTRHVVAAETLSRGALCTSCGHALLVVVDEPSAAILEPPPRVTSQSAAPHGSSAERSDLPDEYATAPPPVQLDRTSVPPAAPRTVAQVSSGQRVGIYDIQRPLGRGGMGEVWLAHDGMLNRLVAIKVLPPSYAYEPTRLARFLREARLAAQVQHPNVVIVYQAAVEGGLTYVAMEYVEGGSLDRLIADRRPMPWDEATRAIRDAAAGLAAAHAVGLVHRDVKPGNLLRTAAGITKVADFGLARAIDASTQLTQEGMTVGTPAFMAPELWRGAEADVRSDVYALAFTYYCLLTAKAPFSAATIPALGYLHQHEPFPNPRQYVPDLPHAVCEVVLRAAAKDPNQRTSTAQLVAEQCDALLRGAGLPGHVAAGNVAPPISGENRFGSSEARVRNLASTVSLPGARPRSHKRSKRKFPVVPVLILAGLILSGALLLPRIWQSDASTANSGPSAEQPTSLGQAGLPPRPLTAAERRIEAALDEVCTIAALETPLQDFLDFLQDYRGIYCRFDLPALEAAGINTDYPITYNLNGLTLRSALNLALRDHGMVYVVTDEVVLITTPEGAKTLAERSGRDLHASGR